MVGLQNAQNNARRAQEALYYTSVCDIISYQDVTDPTTMRTTQAEVAVAKQLPCRLSFESSRAASQTETAAAVAQGVKLFLAPDIAVPAGSKIVVTQNGRTTVYAASGEAAVYPTHQEIMLELFRGWA